MKEKIKQIWNEAASSHTQAETSRETQENFLNRFSEILIRECLLAVDNTNRHHIHTTFDQSLVETTIYKSKEAIKKHFE